MARRLAHIGAMIAVCAGLLVVGPPAGASAPLIWDITEVSSTGGLGATRRSTATLQCPAGKTPLSGGYSADQTDVRVLAQTFQFQSGGRFYLSLADLAPEYASVTVKLWCVPTTYFSGARQVVQSFTVGSNNIAAGTVGCAAGEKALHASMTFGGTESTLLSSYPNAGLGSWYVKGWNADVGSSMVVWVWCVSASDFGPLRTYNTGTAIGWGTQATASCGAGMQPITGGTYHSGGDGGAVTAHSRPFNTTGSYDNGSGMNYWDEGGWRSVGLSTSGGYMITNVMCLPASLPVFRQFSAAPAPNPDSTSARWDFEAVDPAAAAGYGLTRWCYFSAPNTPAVLHSPCSSPFQVNGLADGSYNLTVHAQTGDGRYDSEGMSSVVIDTTPPTATAASDLYPTADPALGFSVQDRTRVEQLECGVDGATPDECGDGYVPGWCDDMFSPPTCWEEYYDYRGSQTSPQTGLSDGPHELRVNTTDERGNAGTIDLPFTVDTQPPTVQQTAPSSRFTVGTTTAVRWTGQDATTDVTTYEVRRRRASYNGDFGTWSTPLVLPGTSTSRTFRNLVRGSTHCFSVRATDEAEHSSPWTSARCTATPLDDRDLTTSNGWATLSPSGYFRGTALQSSTRGATLSITGARVRRLAVVAQKCSTCGVVGVYLAGDRIARLDLHASVRARKVITLPALSSVRTGRVTLKVLSSSKAVRIDALGIGRT